MDLPNPGVKPRSPALQADSLPAAPQGGRKHTHYTPIRMTKVNKIDNPKVCKGVETLELPSAAGGDETIWEIVWQFLKNLNLHTPHHSFSKYLSKRNEGICPYKDLHMFIIALLVLAKTNTQQQFGLTN